VEGGFWILVIVFFLIGPLIERALKGQRPPQQPPRRVPGPYRRPGLPDPQPQEQAETQEGTAPRTAADMIPPDLWELLTGQRRPEQAPPPQPSPPQAQASDPRAPSWRTAPVETASRPAADEESEAYEVVLRRDREARIANAPPTIVSLETEPLSEKRRHARFHEKLEHLAPAATSRHARTVLFQLADRDTMRRAVVLQEILSRPKGLD